MQYKYTAKTQDGKETKGTLDAASLDLAVGALQRKNLLIIFIEPVGEKPKGLAGLLSFLDFFSSVKMQDVVLFSRELATLFEAKVPIVNSLNIIISETENKTLRRVLSDVLDDIQGGISLSQAFSRHEKVFSRFYVSMVKSGEESGKLEEIFKFLADYLERTFELQRKARNALIYPAFVLSAFVVVMILMLVFVIPKLSTILEETGQAVPIYTKIVIGASDFLRNFGFFVLIFLALLGVFIFRYAHTGNGKVYFARFLISIPIIGNLYRKIYLSRIADNLSTLLSGGITALRALDITSEVVDNEIYRRILVDSLESVKGGSMISDSLSKYKDIPSLFSQMIRIGEETGKLDYILKSLAGFYKRDVDNMVDNLVTLIEPILILALGLGVGLLVASVLIPIYNLSTAF
ncbi:MAG TPA: type II secretion system F family protein [Candidatus Paceibacterota bacterium]